MKYLILTFITIYSTICFSQVSLNQLPKVTIDNLNSKVCKIDSSAEAQIIHDIGFTNFWVNNNQIEHIFEKTTRIQILNKSGYDYATIEIPYYKKEQIMNFTATSYNCQDGKIISETVDKKVLYEEKINKSWNRKKYAFSNVKEGTIIEYSYKISSPYNFNLPAWNFQHDIPVLNSKYKFNTCPYYDYIVLRKGFMKYDLDTTYIKPFGFTLLEKDYNTKVYEWELNNVPAYKDKSFVPSNNEYKMKVEFQLESYHGIYGGKFDIMTTWEQLIDKLLDDTNSFGFYIKSAKKSVKKILRELPLNEKNDYEKIIEIVQYVKNNYYWNKHYGLFATQSKKKFIDSKSGNVADINLFLHSLLKEAGVKSSPILISTRNHGKVYYQYPFINLFNYVAVMVTDETGNYYIDATDPLLPLKMLPKECINEYGLQIKKVNKGKDAQFFSLTPIKVDLTKTNQSFTIDVSNNQIEGHVQMKLEGNRALAFRNKIQKNGVESIYDDLTMKSSIEIIQLDIKNLENTKKPLVLNYTTKTDMETIGNKIFITPFPTSQYSENKLKKKSRIYPVDFGNLSEEQLFLTIAIPKGYEIDYVLESNSLKKPELDLEFSYLIQKKESLIQIMIKTKRGRTKYDPVDYKELKSFFDMIVKNINENIVLKKTKDTATIANKVSKK